MGCTGGFDSHQHLAAARRGNRAVFDFQAADGIGNLRVVLLENNGAHRFGN